MVNKQEIRAAIDECMADLEARPSLEGIVRARLQPKAHVRLSVVLAILLTLLTAAALASGLYIWRMEQQQIGSLNGCVSKGDTLYLLTSRGLQTWQPGDESPTVVQELERWDALLFQHEEAVGLFYPEDGTVWRYDGALTQIADGIVLPGLDIDSAVYQDGWLFVRALPRESSVYESTVYRINLSTGTMENLDIPGVMELCAYRPGELLALTGDVAEAVDCLITIDTTTGQPQTQLHTTSLQGMEALTWDGRSIYAVVGGALSRWNGAGWTALQGYASHHLAAHHAIVGNGMASVSYGDVVYLPFAPADTLPTLTIRGYMTLNNEDANFQQLHPGVAVQRERMPTLQGTKVRQAIESGDTTDLFHVKLDQELIDLAREGLIAPLTDSSILLNDTADILPALREKLFVDGELYFTPYALSITAGEYNVSLYMPGTLVEADTYPTRMIVYALNPNAAHPELAMQYLESIATHRMDMEEALFKPHLAPEFYQTVIAPRILPIIE